MILDRRPHPLALIAAGLLGMSLHAVALRFPHPALLSEDLVRGVWYGVCLGLEVLGLYLLRGPKPGQAA